MRKPVRSFPVKGQPVAKARARQGTNKKTGGRFWYTPSKTAKAEQLIALAYRANNIGTELIDQPVMLKVNFFFQMPKSWAKKKKEAHNGRPHTQKPDLDNLVKTVKDALNKIAWHDDSQVFSVTAEKYWTAGEGMTRVEITTEKGEFA